MGCQRRERVLNNFYKILDSILFNGIVTKKKQSKHLLFINTYQITSPLFIFSMQFEHILARQLVDELNSLYQVIYKFSSKKTKRWWIKFSIQKDGPNYRDENDAPHESHGIIKQMLLGSRGLDSIVTYFKSWKHCMVPWRGTRRALQYQC